MSRCLAAGADLRCSLADDDDDDDDDDELLLLVLASLDPVLSSLLLLLLLPLVSLDRMLGCLTRDLIPMVMFS